MAEEAAKGEEFPADPIYLDPHVVERFWQRTADLDVLARAGIDIHRVLRLGRRYAPRRYDVRAVLRALDITHGGTSALPRGSGCICRFCGLYETGSACSCAVCRGVALETLTHALGPSLPEVRARLREAIDAASALYAAIDAIPQLPIWVDYDEEGRCHNTEDALVLNTLSGPRRMRPTRPGAGLFWGRSPALDDWARDIDEVAKLLAIHDRYLARSVGRPPEDAENAWIKGFAVLANEASTCHARVGDRPGRGRPRWFDRQGCKFFELFFGWTMSESDYTKNRANLLRTGTRSGHRR